LERKGKKMKPFEKCPVCGGELKNKQVEKLLPRYAFIAEKGYTLRM